MCTEKKAKIDKIINLYQLGYSCKDICEACNMSPLTVRTYLREAGYDTRSYRKVSDTNREKILLLVKAGYSYRQIEMLLHLSTHLVREIVLQAGLIGFAPRYHHPIKLDIDENNVSTETINKLGCLYSSGKYGLAKCANKVQSTDEEFLWFVFHLSKDDVFVHTKNVRHNIQKMIKADFPVMAVAKKMDISPAIVKRIIR